jgi:uncharacterized protein
MHYHIILTDQCNLQCRYCYEKSVKDCGNHLDSTFAYNFSAPSKLQVDTRRLKKFLEKDQDPVLIFYGGEPLLAIEKLKEIMDTLDIPFRLQTNGIFLNHLPKPYMNRIQKVLVSLDGTRERTDYNRGEGTHDKVMKTVSSMKKWYKGEIVARMTIAQDCPDIYDQVISLLQNGFSSVHWQLDAGFYRFDFDEKTFARFVEAYNKDISNLITYWVEQMEEKTVLMLYPFVGIVSSLLVKENTRLRCGAGHAGYTITTDGTIVACPIGTHIEDFVAGTLETDPQKLKKFEITGRCLRCSLRNICGGRCLYWNKAHLWPEKGDDLICKTIRHLIEELEKKLPIIEKLIRKNTIKKDDFVYEKYFGPEIIP